MFDDYDREEKQVASNLIVGLSGGTGTDRADSAITLHLAKFGNASGSFVVTQDRVFRAEANAIGAVYVPIGMWHLFLEELGVLPRFEHATPTQVAPEHSAPE